VGVQRPFVGGAPTHSRLQDGGFVVGRVYGWGVIIRKIVGREFHGVARGRMIWAGGWGAGFFAPWPSGVDGTPLVTIEYQPPGWGALCLRPLRQNKKSRRAVGRDEKTDRRPGQFVPARHAAWARVRRAVARPLVRKIGRGLAAIPPIVGGGWAQINKLRFEIIRVAGSEFLLSGTFYQVPPLRSAAVRLRGHGCALLVCCVDDLGGLISLLG